MGIDSGIDEDLGKFTDMVFTGRTQDHPPAPQAH